MSALPPKTTAEDVLRLYQSCDAAERHKALEAIAQANDSGRQLCAAKKCLPKSHKPRQTARCQSPTELTIAQVARALQLHRGTIFRFEKSGHLVGNGETGHNHRIYLASVLLLLIEHEDKEYFSVFLKPVASSIPRVELTAFQDSLSKAKMELRLLLPKEADSRKPPKKRIKNSLNHDRVSMLDLCPLLRSRKKQEKEDDNPPVSSGDNHPLVRLARGIHDLHDAIPSTNIPKQTKNFLQSALALADTLLQAHLVSYACFGCVVESALFMSLMRLIKLIGIGQRFVP